MANNYQNIPQQAVQPQYAQQPVPPQIKSKGSKSIYMIVCFVVVLLMVSSLVGGIYIGSKYLSSKNGEEPNTDNGTTDDNGGDTDGDEDGTDTDGTEYDEGAIKVTSPVSNQEVNGKVFVEGDASDFLDELTVKIYDDDWNTLAEETAALESTDKNTIKAWSIFADITQSPTTLKGSVRVFPTERGESSKLTKTIAIRFQNLIAPGRLKVFSPLKSQVMEGTAVSFRGQMKDFLEGNMGVRLLDESEKQLYEDIISASSDNYDKYAQFEKSVEFKMDLSRRGTRGTWELFEVDIEGEAGDVILSIPVRFPED